VANCRVFTLAGMAMRLAAPVLHDQGLSYCNDKAQLFLVDGILRGFCRDSSGYFSELHVGLSLSRRVCAMLDALELAGIGPDDITRDHFESDAKHADVVLVFKTYRQRLQELKQVDYSDVLKIAAQTVGGGSGETTAAPPLVIVPTELELCELERRLLETLPHERVLYLPGDADEFDLTDWSKNEQERIAKALEARMATDPRPTFDFFTASGECNEIREVLRRCIADNIPLDDVEIVYTDAASYVPVIYETVLAVCPEPVFEWSKLPVTFAEGIPVRYSRPGRALQAWLEWMRNDFPQATLTHLIEDGLLNFGDDYFEDSHFLRLGRMLRGLVIVNGRDRYLPVLAQPVARARGKARILSVQMAAQIRIATAILRRCLIGKRSTAWWSACATFPPSKVYRQQSCWIISGLLSLNFVGPPTRWTTTRDSPYCRSWTRLTNGRGAHPVPSSPLSWNGWKTCPTPSGFSEVDQGPDASMRRTS
jgi:hypothetical protein